MNLWSRQPVGIYEKAFAPHISWDERLQLAREAGYDFVEMSIDESDERLARLDWTAVERAELRRTIATTGVPILTLGLSGHRKFPLGSESADVRQRALEILRRTIEFASDIGTRIIQIMGYDVFYEPSNADSKMRFLDGLQQGARWAATCGVMLGLENVDCDCVDSVEKAMRFVRQVDSPWFHAYPDMGNLFASGLDPCEQLPMAEGRIAGVHVKDTSPGVYRGVPFQKGGVPFDRVFQILAEIGFWGPLTVEMWFHMDETGDPLAAAAAARKMVDRLIAAAWGD